MLSTFHHLVSSQQLGLNTILKIVQEELVLLVFSPIIQADLSEVTESTFLKTTSLFSRIGKLSVPAEQLR